MTRTKNALKILERVTGKNPAIRAGIARSPQAGGGHDAKGAAGPFPSAHGAAERSSAEI